MKTSVLITLVTFAFSATKAQFYHLSSNEDPINVVCKPSEDGLVVFVPHPYECNKYFMCQGLTGIAMQCPGNLQFDTSLNVCNYANVVGCINTPYPTTSTTEMPETTTTDDEENTTVFDEDYGDYKL